MTRFVIGFFLLTCSVVNAEQLKAKVRAKAAIVYNPDSGAVLFEKRAKEPHYPASILKIATAYFALEEKKLNLEETCQITDDVLEVMHADIKQADPTLYPAHVLEHDGVTMGLKRGKSYRMKDLLHGLLLVSGNDAANAIAKHCSGSVKDFMNELNHFLEDKGIHQTRFQNPHGLHHPAQMTTAFDMAKIAGLAFANEQFLEISKTPSFQLEGGGTIKNTNRLLKEGKYFYPKFIGGKTGYTSSAGYNLVAVAEDKGRRLVVVLLGCEDSTKRFEDAISLFETAFREKLKKRILFSKEHEPFTRKIKGGNRLLRAHIDRDVEIEYYPSEEPKPTARLVWKQLPLPIEIGEVVCHLEVKDERGNLLASTPLFADVEVRKNATRYVFWTALWVGLMLAVLVFFKKRRKVLKG